MVTPWKKNLRILGLGTTIGTTVEGITAEVLVVSSFEDLATKQDDVSQGQSHCNLLSVTIIASNENISFASVWHEQDSLSISVAYWTKDNLIRLISAKPNNPHTVVKLSFKL